MFKWLRTQDKGEKVGKKNDYRKQEKLSYGEHKKKGKGKIRVK